VASVTAIADEFKFFYGVNWNGNACDNLALAKNLGYQYVMYQSGMRNCYNAENMKFYLESPDVIGFDGIVDGSNTQNELNLLHDYYSWANESSLATGWYFTPDRYRALVDFQQQRAIDRLVNQTISSIANYENLARNFTFAGYAWDVPQLEGDFWSGYQDIPSHVLCLIEVCDGHQVTIRYFTGSDSTYLLPGITHEYSSYKDGKAAYFKKLLAETKARGYETRFIVEPYTPWNDWFRDSYYRSDYSEFKPDLIAIEGSSTYSGTVNSLNQSLQRVSAGELSSTQPNIYGHFENLQILGWIATHGSWQGNYGRWGGTGDVPSFSDPRTVPARLKLLKAVAGWENINEISLSNRYFNSTAYYSSDSYIDGTLIAATHPRSSLIYVVVLSDDNSGVPLNNDYEAELLDGLMAQTGNLINGTFSNNRLYLPVGSYVLHLKPEPEPEIVLELVPEPLGKEPLPLENGPVLFGNEQQQVENQSYVPTYAKSDLSPIVVDGVGTFLASVVSWTEVVVLLGILVFMVWMVGKYREVV
jgi:hypothetical protein